MNQPLDLSTELRWVAVDTETTGLNPWKHELLEIGAVRFGLQGITEEFQVLIKPQHKIDPRARAVHNISNEELEEKGVSLQEALQLFSEFISGDDLVFHNAPFDAAFLVLSFRSLQLPIPDVIYYDSLYLSRVYFPGRKSHSLDNLRKELEIDSGPSHRALSDARATSRVFLANFEQNRDILASRKKYDKYLRYHRRLAAFEVKVPSDLDRILKYFERKVSAGALLRIDYYNRDEKKFSSATVKPLDVLIFNQLVYVKAQKFPLEETFLIPLKGAVIHDPIEGAIKLVD